MGLGSASFLYPEGGSWWGVQGVVTGSGRRWGRGLCSTKDKGWAGDGQWEGPLPVPQGHRMGSNQARQRDCRNQPAQTQKPMSQPLLTGISTVLSFKVNEGTSLAVQGLDLALSLLGPGFNPWLGD